MTRDWYRFVYITDDKYIKAAEPIDASCDCLTCSRYSRGYLHHLHRANEAAFQRLATIHNLRFMTRLLTDLTPFLPAQAPMDQASSKPAEVRHGRKR